MSALIKWFVAVLADVSPKVKAGLTWGFIAALLLAFLNGVTPEMLGFLGKYEPFVWAVLPVLIAAVAAWSKADPLRDAGKAEAARQPVPGVEVPDVTPVVGESFHIVNTTGAPVSPAPSTEPPTPPTA